MRILTVRQPWAWAIIHGGKDVENRVWGTTYRGPVAIHVAGKYAEAGLDLEALDDACDRWCDENGCANHPWFSSVGKIIGVVDLVDSHMCFNALTAFEGCSPWAEIDRRHLVLANPRPLPKPLPYKGALGLRELPDYVGDFLTERTSASKEPTDG